LVTTVLKLNGLEADNLLAFLALLGLLRALDFAKPQWRARAVWRGTPILAELQVDSISDANEIVASAEHGIQSLARAYTFDRRDITYEPDEFRRLAEGVRNDRRRAELVAALASEGAAKRGGETVEVTPLCAMFGQGHQHFLTRLAGSATRDHPANLADLSDAIFKRWRYEDDTDGLRWDPIEDRRYAHQFGDPSEGKNQIGTVTGANRLASIGFATFTSVPRATGLVTLGISGRRGEADVSWPLPSVPTSLSGYIALLTNPALGLEEEAGALRAYGVHGVARARRFTVGKYVNFERARIQVL
jgi:hypothetical protein